MNRFMLIAAVVCLAGVLGAQATFNVNGTVQANEEQYRVLDIDFGVATSSAITVAIAGNSATEGLEVFLADLDAAVTVGLFAAADQASDAGTGTINLSVTSATYTGTHQFVLYIRSSTTGGPVTYTGTVDAAALATGAITQSAAESVIDNGYTLVHRLMDRAIQGGWSVDASGTPEPMEFMVDFGGTAQAINFCAVGEGSITGDLEVFEILANGTANSVGTVSGTGADWSGDGVFASSSRSGVVRFRVVADTPNMDFTWSVILPSTATVQPFTQINFMGSLNTDQERLHLFQIDLGPVNTTVMLQFASFNDSGSLSGGFIDLDELADNGIATGFLTFAEVIYLSGQGVKEFALSVSEDGIGTATYDITVEVSVPSSSASVLSTLLLPAVVPFQSLFDRGVRAEESTTAAGSVMHDFNVDFGSTTHTCELWFQCDAVSGVTLELFEINSGGTPISLGSLTPAGTAEANATSSARTGVVTFRVVITTTAAATFDYAVVFDGTVAVQTIGGGGGSSGGGSDSGCSSGEGTGFGLLALLGVLMALGCVRARVFRLSA